MCQLSYIMPIKFFYRSYLWTQSGLLGAWESQAIKPKEGCPDTDINRPGPNLAKINPNGSDMDINES